jgi:four helix bundle protein
MDIGYIESKQGKEWINETEEISKMLYGLIKSIKAKTH